MDTRDMGSQNAALQTGTTGERLEWESIGRFVREQAKQLANEHWQSLNVAVGRHHGAVGKDGLASAPPETN